jgi:hypothetical protein
MTMRGIREGSWRIGSRMPSLALFEARVHHHEFAAAIDRTHVRVDAMRQAEPVVVIATDEVHEFGQSHGRGELAPRTRCH